MILGPSARLAAGRSVTTPAVLPALALIGGIAAGVLAPAFSALAVTLLISSCLLAVYAWRTTRDRVFVVSVIVGFGCAGELLGSARLDAARRSPLRAFFDDAQERSEKGLPPMTVEGGIRQDASPAEYGAAMTVDVARVQTACGWLPAPGGLRLAITGTAVAERLSDWRAGRRVRLPVVLRRPTSFRDPGVADEAFAMMRRGISLSGSVKSGMLVDIVERGHPVAELAGAIRVYTRRTVATALPDRPIAAAILVAILVGDRGDLDPELERRLQEAGTYHVIAISGGNVAILAGLVLVVLRLARMPARPGAVLVALVICGYGYVAGGGASVARATLAATVYLVATAADHRTPALNVLATVALVAVLYDPLSVFDPGLLLSYGATLALLIAADRVWSRTAANRGSSPGGSGDAETRRGAEASSASLRGSASPSPLRLRVRAVLRAAGHAALVILVGTVAAEVALLPIGATTFHRLTVAGIALNFLAIPLMTVAQVAGLAVLFLAPVSAGLAHAAAAIGALAAEGLTRSTWLLELAPWLAWRVPAPSLWLVTAYYSGWLALLFSSRRSLRVLGGVASVCATLLIGWPALGDGVLARRSPKPGQLRVTFLDVGQGDSIVVQFPGGRSLLIDAAGLPGSSFDLGDRVITPALLALGIRRLHYLAITHGDPDHVEGAPSVARDFAPFELWEGVPVPPHERLTILEHLVAKQQGAVRLVRPGDRLTAGPVELRVLHPPEPDWERQRVRNDDSIVMELRFGDVSIVLPGDIGAGIEESLATKLSDARIRILKAAHHGSATSSGETWLAAARPSAVIFSCGRDNRYGHPAPVVLERVKKLRAAIFRTDLDGAITVTTDGKSATVTTFTGRSSRIRVTDRQGAGGGP